MAEEKNVQEEQLNTEENPAEGSTPACEDAPAEDKKAKKCSKKEKADASALRTELEQVKAQLEEERKQHLYLAAEYENYRRRSQTAHNHADGKNQCGKGSLHGSCVEVDPYKT